MWGDYDEVENKTITYIIANILYLFITAVVTLGCAQIFENKTGLILGIVFMVAGAPFAIVYKDVPLVCIILFFLNSVFTGMALSICYTATEFTISFVECVLSCLIAFGAFLIMMFLNKIPFVARFKTIKIVANLALIITIILVNAFAFEIKENDMYMLSGVLSIMSVAFVFAMQRKDYDFEDLCKSLLICSYSVFVVAAVAAIIIVTEGDAADGFGGDGAKNKDVDLTTAMYVASDIAPVAETPPKEEKEEQTKGENNG